MTIGLLALALGLVFGGAAIIIPRLVAYRSHPEDDADARAYLEITGRSAEDIVRGNRGGASGEESTPGSARAGGTGTAGNRSAPW